MSPDITLESIRAYRDYHDKLYWSPPDFHRDLDEHITGQDEAKRIASTVLYNHLEGRPSVTLFHGNTGCGKTELWRVLQKDFHMIYIFDSSTMSAEGWSGSNKLSSLLRQVKPEWRRNAILVFDEFDKLITPRYASGGGGWNTSLLLQEQLLKMCDHDILYFGAERESPAFSLNCEGVSVVFLGAFSSLKKQKAEQKQAIGFSASIRQENTANALTIQDIIDFGLIPELAGRIMRIVQMDDLTIQDYIQIGTNEVKRLEEMYKKPIQCDPSILVMLARMAIKEGLGARFIKHKLRIMVEDTTQYYDPLADSITLTYQHEGALPYESMRCTPAPVT
mgnify:CR=1 FL=1